MPAVRRQKACTACAESKRKCDKQLPECQRCLDRDVDCVYPLTNRRRRDLIASDSLSANLYALQSHANASTLGDGLDLGDWGAIGASSLNIPHTDVTAQFIPFSPIPGFSLPAEGPEIGSEQMSGAQCLWFLREETWVRQHCNEVPECVPVIELESYIRAVEELLQSWVKDGYNSFIHRRLYEKGMPTCLQDAFTTLAAYTARTPAVKELVLQIAEERTSAIACQNMPISSSVQGILAHLAHTQALFILVFIQLFDGSVRFRASAEKHLATLRQWTDLMPELVKQFRDEGDHQTHRSLQWIGSGFNEEYEVSSEMWQLWILVESLRRSHIIIDTIMNTYQAMINGWTECSGTVMFTVRSGLWQAETAMKWFELSSAKPPLLIPSSQPGPLISEYEADEVDEFAKMFWTYIVGKDRIQCWIDRGNETSRV